MTPLTRRLGLETPLIQAPMAGTSTPELAAAVSNAGALGSIAVGAIGPDAARAQIRATRALTDRTFNVNVFCHAPEPRDEARNRVWIEALSPLFASVGATPPDSLREIYSSFLIDDGMLAVLVEERPPVVSFHFGLPKEGQVSMLKGAGVTLLATATTPEEGRAAQASGIDMVVAQGVEAGGHRGAFEPPDDRGFGLFPLVRLLVTDLSIPVIAAGGIMDGAGIAAALALGASGAQLGTAFVACPESAADAVYRRALLGPEANRTRVSAAISGRPARGIENAFMRRADETLAAPYPWAYDLGKALNAAARASGDDGYAAHWAGQGAPLARTLPAAELVGALTDEMRTALESLRTL